LTDRTTGDKHEDSQDSINNYCPALLHLAVFRKIPLIAAMGNDRMQMENIPNFCQRDSLRTWSLQQQVPERKAHFIRLA
jgi:hypothetical protein